MFLEYQHERNYIRVIKVPISKSGIQALYANFVYRSSKSTDPFAFDASENYEFAGYIDKNGEVRFPKYIFTHSMLDSTEGIRMENKEVVLSAAIRKEVHKLAFADPLPPCPNPENAYYQARKCVFLGQKEFPFPTKGNFYEYISDSTVIDYLTETPHWAEKIAQNWAKSLGGYGESGELTKLDVFRMEISADLKIKKHIQEIENNPKEPVHRYAAMRKAVAGAKTVWVDFVTRTGKIDSTQILAKEFEQECSMNEITLYSLPYKEYSRVKNLLLPKVMPDGHEVPTCSISKDDIVAIRYKGKTIWEKIDK